MQGLKEISSYCPHFCKGIGLIKCQIDAKYKKEEENPFIIRNKYPIEKDILLCEFIDKSSKFYNYIRNKNVDENVLYSIVKQVLLAIAIAQKEKRFSQRLFGFQNFAISHHLCAPQHQITQITYFDFMADQ